MKRRVLSVLLGLASTVAAAQGEPQASAIAGHYYLQGVRETGSELLLRPDGRFQWAMSYGAVDQRADGSWKRVGDKVLLITDAPSGGAWVSLKDSVDWNADIEYVWRTQQRDGEIEAINARCPFLQAQPAENTADPRASETTEQRDEQALATAIRVQEQKLATYVTRAEAAAAVAMRAPPDQRAAAMDAASKAMADYWREQYALKNLYWDRPGPKPSYVTLKLPKECVEPPEPQRESSPESWQPRVAVYAHDADDAIVYGHIAITLIYGDGRSEVLETNGSGYAMSAQTNGPMPVMVQVGDRKSVLEGMPIVEIKIPPQSKRVLPLAIESRKISGPAFVQMELRIDGGALVPVWGARGERGRYVRE